MSPPCPHVSQSLLNGPDYLNASVYSMNMATGTVIYDETHTKLGVKGVYSFRPNSTSFGAIQLVSEDGSSRRFHRIIKYQWLDGFVVYDQC